MHPDHSRTSLRSLIYRADVGRVHPVLLIFRRQNKATMNTEKKKPSAT